VRPRADQGSARRARLRRPAPSATRRWRHRSCPTAGRRRTPRWWRRRSTGPGDRRRSIRHRARARRRWCRS
ncbi:hypothetical protein LTR94_038329, partial [Friedmanniomyces endolithicus]